LLKKAFFGILLGRMESTATQTTQIDLYTTFGVGDTVRVMYKIIEAGKERIQPFEGIVIGKKGEQASKTFTVRRIGAGGIGVERIFPVYSPNITGIQVVKQGKVRRAKLYYLRGKIGKAATRVKERKEIELPTSENLYSASK
jgi:large subunit ribosomal protein L19